MTFRLISVLVFVLSVSMLLIQSEGPALVAGFTPEEAVQYGQRMYRQGILPSGRPMQALVQGDIPVDGTMFSCISCHLRSGLGATEGSIISLPVNGAELFQPLARGQEVLKLSPEQQPRQLSSTQLRPAYTEATLARAIRDGVDAGGRSLDRVMPRYKIDDRDMAVLIHYLRHLSSRISPGVDDTTIHFATVITDDVEPALRDAMLLTLQAHVRDRNSQSRHDEERARKGPYYKDDMFMSYRRWSLTVWELQGDPSTWTEQLQEYYRQRPVFALLGGISNQDWRPIHDFCQQQQLPCVLPITPYPVIADDDWYTLYFSKSYDQEAESAARFIRSRSARNQIPPLVQVYRNGPAASRLADSFRQTADRLRLGPVIDVLLPAEQPADAGFWNQLGRGHGGAAVLLWLTAADLGRSASLAEWSRPPAIVIAAGSLLGEKTGAVPAGIRDMTYLTYPHSLPEEARKSLTVLRRWLKVRDVPVTDEVIQSKVYFIGWMLSGVIRHMRRNYYRDHFLDVWDMMNDETYAISVYPRVSFGPGQRYLAKGCYMVQLTKDPEPQLVRRSDWLIH
ncbi:MAG: ABC transporter substrate-binding protein [Acidobacteria bacterium]|nr:ABC transporter substrate-binding protein [Acidobacteriota bacterium]